MWPLHDRRDRSAVLIALLIAHSVVGLAIFALGSRLGRRGLVVAALPPLATIVWLATQLDGILDGNAVSSTHRWVPSLSVELALRLDAFAAVMVLAVSGIGLAVLAYAWSYFESSAPDDVGRLAGLLTVFAGAMLGVVVADDLIVLFTAWELTSITSYLLIGNQYRKIQARAAALHALLVTSAGGLVMLGGIVLIGQAAGTMRLSAIVADPPSGATVTAGIVCVAIGAFTKSAQYPFHSWLPGAMAAPTPVSAYLHSATMVKAGIYIVGRFAPVFATVGVWRPLVLTVGMVTMISAGLRALRQYDLKLLLAYGTVSQLGFMMVLLGAGTDGATAAGEGLIVAHALFKAAMFMVVGMIDHQVGTRDIRLMPPLGRGWGGVKIVAVLSAASMAGVPLLAGFIAKEAAYAEFVDNPFSASGVVLVAMVTGATLTGAYSLRFLWGAFLLPDRLRAGTERVTVRHPDQGTADHDQSAPAPSPWFVAPAAVLAAFSLVIGVLPVVIDRLVMAATLAVDPDGHPHHLKLWHGFNVPLALSAVSLAAGVGIFLARRSTARLLRVGDVVPNGTEVYLAILQGLNRLATRVTAIVQNGTLTIYAGVVLATAAVLPGIVLLREVNWPGWPDFVGRPAEIPITIVLVGGALLAASVRRRFTAVLFLSTVGYGMAALFVIAGAPDLALTQAAVETLSTVLFVLVLRKLPDRFERRSSPVTRSIRVVVSVTVAVVVFAFAIVARESRVAEPVSSAMVEQSLPEAKGRNVVNVILVDFRGFDTMGEITVLAAAAVGCVALARAGRRPRRRVPVEQESST
ncbi:hydrogen gas-evolving membrane-bound hydrogenase subunit E [Desertimonas flava]|uniref:hydrogen gas-evolving membrane-bound hydrogenase subunit E n=1 Tax=Desertimonas flava TaxID=2064846 RepID=UPI000E355A72|nr:hydrogen gas-evolving membrane-bound hydrogenase subunit E [Desertimonas flava]